MFNKKEKSSNAKPPTVWARPEMQVTFRAEIMPGKSRQERTFRIKEVLPTGRVRLYDFPDEHREGSFERLDFKRNLSSKP
jgi:hypothetical protein